MKIELVKEVNSSTVFWVMVDQSYKGLSDCFTNENEAHNYFDKLVSDYQNARLPEVGQTILKTVEL